MRTRVAVVQEIVFSLLQKLSVMTVPLRPKIPRFPLRRDRLRKRCIVHRLPFSPLKIIIEGWIKGLGLH